jgi:glycosyltransferase involved in cell wall biosynthesis
MPYALALRKASQALPQIPIYHWIHSKPTAPLDWWDYSEFPHHTMVYPSWADLQLIREVFKTDHAVCVPHAQDIRDMRRFRNESKDLIELIPGLLEAEIVQIYPASTDRFPSKGVKELILLFSILKSIGHSVCLVIANQSSHARERRLVDPIAHMEKVAYRCHLDNREVVFTSELLHHKYASGVPHDILQDLFACSNLFAFPSHSESFGMVLYEAILSGGVLPVLNNHVESLKEVFEGCALYADFGTVLEPNCTRDTLMKTAGMISEHFLTNPILLASILVKRQFNYQTIFSDYYRPLLNGALLKSISKTDKE